MSDLKNVSLFDVLSVPTQELGGAGNFTQQILPENAPNPDDFSKEITSLPEAITHAELKEEPYTDEDARNEADKIVNLIDFANVMVLPMIGTPKIKKKYGGKQGFEAMKKANVKKLLGEKLTEKEEKLATAMEGYQKQLKQFNGIIPMSERERDIMVKAFVPMCKDSKIKLNVNFVAISAILGIEFIKIKAVIEL